MEKSGKLIVIDGLDGCGGETQTKLLTEKLKQGGKDVVNFTFPNYDSPIGQFIDSFLHNKYDLSPEIQTLFHYAGFLEKKNEIETALCEGKFVICDRYVTTTMVYQGVQGIAYESIEKLISAFNIPKPDICIYLDISSNTSAERKMAEKGNLDRFEINLNFLDEVAKKYKDYAEKNVYCRQEIINGEKSKQEVLNDIITAINSI